MGACCHGNGARRSRSHGIGREEWCRLMYKQSARFPRSELLSCGLQGSNSFLLVFNSLNVMRGPTDDTGRGCRNVSQ